MNDIEQFRQLMQGNTQSIATDQIVPKKNEPDHSRWTGVVINNNDPEQLGRCQIKIYGYYDELATNNIPWAIPDIKSLASTKGNFVVPELNTIVRGYFDNGDDSKPVYDSVAFNSSYTDQTTNPRDWMYRTEDYPHTMVLFQTDQNDYLIMNRKTGEISFNHHTGTVTKIDSDGNIDIATSIYTNGGANLNINVSGNININAYGDTTISAMGNVDVQSTTGQITLGNNPAKQLVNNFTQCVICGAPHCIGNIQVKV